MKLYIIGPCGSGKSTLARNIAAQANVPLHALDRLFYAERFSSEKRPSDERDALLAEILAAPQWVIEDIGRPCFTSAFEQTDNIVLLDLPGWLIFWRLLKRHCKQVLKLEQCDYKPSLRMLGLMCRGLKRNSRNDLKQRLEPYADKVIALRCRRDVNQYNKTA